MQEESSLLWWLLGIHNEKVKLGSKLQFWNKSCVWRCNERCGLHNTAGACVFVERRRRLAFVLSLERLSQRSKQTVSRLELELTIVQHWCCFAGEDKARRRSPRAFFVESIWLIRPTHSQPLIGIAAGICCLCHPREQVDTQSLISVVLAAAAFGNRKFLPGGRWRPDVQVTFGDLPVMENQTLKKGLMLLRVVFFFIMARTYQTELSEGADPRRWLARRDWILLPACRLDPNVSWKHSCLSEHSVFSSSALLALSLTAGTESAPLFQTVYSRPGMSRVRLEAQVLFWVVSCLTGKQCYLLFVFYRPFLLYHNTVLNWDSCFFVISTSHILASLT